MKALLVALTLVSSAAFAAPECTVSVVRSVRLPNGPMNLSESNLDSLRRMGYTAKFVESGYRNIDTQYILTVTARCGLNNWNPFLSMCEAKATLQDSKEYNVVATGNATQSFGVGFYVAPVEAAVRDLPNCGSF